jgi:NitT/TauT family transport system substrate-binding protein
MITRRAFLGGLLPAAMALGGCRRSDEPGVLRLGYLANLSHGPMIAGIASGRFQAKLAPLRIEARVFRAGPRVVEALLGHSIDIGTSGPAPVVITQARHGEGTFRVLSGCASGGASLVVAKGITRPADLRGKTLATPQLGSTQDIALRKWLRDNGLETSERGGDVRVTTFANATILTQLSRGELAGAWLPEPWGTRVVYDKLATRFVDERDLWPNRAFSSSLAVARQSFVSSRADDVARFMEALGDEIDRALADPARARAEIYSAIDALTGNAGKKVIFDEAFTKLEYTRDPLIGAVRTFADDAFALGLVPRSGSAGLFKV